MTMPSPDEFVPLPYFPWDYRPESLELSCDEAETALYLAGGNLDAAAAFLKVDRRRLKKAIRHYGRLQVLLTRLAAA